MPIYVEISKSVNSTETEEDLENDFKNNKHDSHWKRFETVSQRLFNLSTIRQIISLFPLTFLLVFPSRRFHL
jgi:hypothetical protein